MALNPFFLQGTASEQRLIQDIVNEHLQFHGVEVTYIPSLMTTILLKHTSIILMDTLVLEMFLRSLV